MLAVRVDLLTTCCPRLSDVIFPIGENDSFFILPAMFGSEISSLELDLFSLPVWFGGVGIFLPRHLANPLYNASRGATRTIVDLISGAQRFDLDVHDDVVSARSDYQRVCDTLFNTLFSEISSKLDPLHLRTPESKK